MTDTFILADLSEICEQEIQSRLKIKYKNAMKEKRK